MTFVICRMISFLSLPFSYVFMMGNRFILSMKKEEEMKGTTKTFITSTAVKILKTPNAHEPPKRFICRKSIPLPYTETSLKSHKNNNFLRDFKWILVCIWATRYGHRTKILCKPKKNFVFQKKLLFLFCSSNQLQIADCDGRKLLLKTQSNFNFIKIT